MVNGKAQTAAYSYSRILLSNTKEQMTDTGYNTEESQTHCAMGENPDPEATL